VLICSLPPDTQGATRDVAEAYRTIPLHHSQWPSLVVRIEEDPPLFAVDTALCFGYGPSAGVYGQLRDSGLDIMRAYGIGPVIAWVDDHLFFRLPRSSLNAYNEWRADTMSIIAQNQGKLHEGCWIWFKGRELADGLHEEWAEDCAVPLKDLTLTSSRTRNEDSGSMYAYDMQDIDSISQELGIPWELSKDTPFTSRPVYLGFKWDIRHKTVQLTGSKQLKYIAAIRSWLESPRHPLNDVESLHGKLSHASLVIPEGSAYLTTLQTMLGMFDTKPFMPRTQLRGTMDNLRWWLCALENPEPIPIPYFPFATDLGAFSDACTSVGIAIIIAGRWRAWRLQPGWDTDNRDIGWAESIGFEFLVYTLLKLNSTTTSFKVHGDNQGIIEAWRKGHSRNKSTNTSFQRIHAALRTPSRQIFPHYVPSGQNPADGPSRGHYPSSVASLPEVPIPPDIAHFVCNYNDSQARHIGLRN